jgi:hypothetical protein
MGIVELPRFFVLKDGELTINEFFEYGDRRGSRFLKSNPREADCGWVMVHAFENALNILTIFGPTTLWLTERRTVELFGFLLSSMSSPGNAWLSK